MGRPMGSMNMMTVLPALGSSPSSTLMGKTMSVPLTTGLLLRVTTASVTSPLAPTIETAALGGMSAKEFSPFNLANQITYYPELPSFWPYTLPG